MLLCRSALYVPGDNRRALEKARGLGADLLILDLEDAVAPDHKAAARENVRAALSAGFPDQRVLVRVNATSTPWGNEDLEMLDGMGVQGVVLPKAEVPAEVWAIAEEMPVWAMVETPLGVLHLEELAAIPGVAGLIMGTSDLVRDLRARHTPGREGLHYALSKAVTCARAYGLSVLDGVSLDFHDEDAFERACRQGRDFGFDGKTVIHPRQVPPANRVFAPSPEDVQRARDVLAVWEAARAQGKSVAVHEGQLVEHLHASEARRLLQFAQEAAARDARSSAHST